MGIDWFIFIQCPNVLTFVHQFHFSKPRNEWIKACTDDCFWEEHIWCFSLSNSLAPFKSFHVCENLRVDCHRYEAWNKQNILCFVFGLCSPVSLFNTLEMNEANCDELESTQWTFVILFKNFGVEEIGQSLRWVHGQVPAGKLSVRGQENSRKIFRPKAC